jgi:hypothetical protein
LNFEKEKFEENMEVTDEDLEYEKNIKKCLQMKKSNKKRILKMPQKSSSVKDPMKNFYERYNERGFTTYQCLETG